jgi:hypothetical protein
MIASSTLGHVLPVCSISKAATVLHFMFRIRKGRGAPLEALCHCSICRLLAVRGAPRRQGLESRMDDENTLTGVCWPRRALS